MKFSPVSLPLIPKYLPQHPFLENLCLCHSLKLVPYHKLEISGIQDVRSKHKTGSTILKEWTTPDSRNTPSTTNLEGDEIVDAPGDDGNASMPVQVKRPNPWRKMSMMMMMMMMTNPLAARYSSSLRGLFQSPATATLWGPNILRIIQPVASSMYGATVSIVWLRGSMFVSN